MSPRSRRSFSRKAARSSRDIREARPIFKGEGKVPLTMSRESVRRDMANALAAWLSVSSMQPAELIEDDEAGNDGLWGIDMARQGFDFRLNPVDRDYGHYVETGLRPALIPIYGRGAF